jgi:hypothetical protein
MPRRARRYPRKAGWADAAAGVRGNSRNPMVDLNSDLVAERILAWLAER